LGFKANGQKRVMRIVVCDTGPLLHLSEAGAIHLLQLAGEIIIPPVVSLEFEQNAQGWNPPQWVVVKELDEISDRKSISWVQGKHIDPGESAAIALAKQLKADWLLTDDAKARQFAESLELEVHGSIGLLLWSMAEGHMKDSKHALNLLEGLANSSLWISERVLYEARRAIDNFFS
jgi:predicted nucleic acid-binding protein